MTQFASHVCVCVCGCGCRKLAKVKVIKEKKLDKNSFEHEIRRHICCIKIIEENCKTNKTQGKRRQKRGKREGGHKKVAKVLQVLITSIDVCVARVRQRAVLSASKWALRVPMESAPPPSPLSWHSAVENVSKLQTAIRIVSTIQVSSIRRVCARHS